MLSLAHLLTPLTCTTAQLHTYTVVCCARAEAKWMLSGTPIAKDENARESLAKVCC